MSERDELKPCPICGGEAETVTHPDNGIHYAGCADPDCIGARMAYDFATIDAAIAAWNTRAPIQPVATQEDAGNVQAAPFAWHIVNKFTQADSITMDKDIAELHALKGHAVEALFKAASQPSNAVQDARNVEVVAWKVHGNDLYREFVTMNRNKADDCKKYGAIVEPLVVQSPPAATVPPLGVPSDEQIKAALDAYNDFPCPINGSISRGWNEEQMASALKAALLTTASNAGEAMLGEKS